MNNSYISVTEHPGHIKLEMPLRSRGSEILPLKFDMLYQYMKKCYKWTLGYIKFFKPQSVFLLQPEEI